MPTKPLVAQDDLQGNVLCGYGNAYEHALYAFVRVHDGIAARDWLGELVPRVTNAVSWGSVEDGPPDTLNVALSFDGLEAIGVPERILATFPEDFRVGMARRAAGLGDVGSNGPDEWEDGLGHGQPHILVTINARSQVLRNERQEGLQARIQAASGGLELVHEVQAGLLDHPAEGVFGREHFGFADGLSQPAIADPMAGPKDRDGRGLPQKDGGWDPVAPGEFVLGYPDEDGVIAEAPADPLRFNGSYTVVRKLHQDVAGWTGYMLEQASGDEAMAERLMAKVVGRWKDGTPLALSPEGPDPRFEDREDLRPRINDFRFGDDPNGLKCPLGAHIRRANPRDALGWEDKLVKRHRIIRRGMPYGARPVVATEPDGEPRGLMFVCYQASIERQFEFIQDEWLHSGDAFDLGDESDCLMGFVEPGRKVTIHGEPPILMPPPPSFVATKGGGYFFTPGIAALRALAEGIMPSV